MKLALIGATGYVGSKILTEALERGHETTAIVRNIDKLPRHSKLISKQADVANTSELAALFAGLDAIISSYNPGLPNGIAGARSIIAAVKHAGAKRLLVVGGAGSLEVAPGHRLVDSPDFPKEWKEGALATAELLNILRREEVLDWTFVSPAAMLAPGTRTGTYRTGKDQLLAGATGESKISLEDYAVAMLDEVEKPAHPRERFTVAY